MGALWRLVEQHRDEQVPYRPNYSQVSRSVGYADRQGLNGWRAPSSLPGPEYLRAFARLAGYP